MHNTYSEEKIVKIRESVKGLNPSQALDVLQNTLGLSRVRCRDLSRKYHFYHAIDALHRQNGVGLVPKDEREITANIVLPTSLEDVLKICQVNRDEWKVKSYAVGQRAKGFAWRVSLEKNLELANAEKMLEIFTKSAAKHAPKYEGVITKVAKNNNRDCLYVLNIQDLHLAKLAWHKETGGADYDIRIAERDFIRTVEDLLYKSPVNRIEEVLVIIGSDMLQVDTDHSTTTAGTYVDSDCRLAKIFEVASGMLVSVIENLATRFKVRAVVIPGNHDAVSSMYLGHYISAWFRNHANVTVDNAPVSRKYVGFGKTLIGFDHGSETKLADLPLIMMRENQATVSNYKYFEVLSGHKHVEDAQEYKGVKVRIAPALCPPDKWHSCRGYIGNVRQSQGLLYQRDNGLEAIFYSTPLA